MRFLITGANGFIGSHLACKLCEMGHEVVGVARRKNSKNPDYNKFVSMGKILHVQGDVLSMDFSSLGKFDGVFHIAGVVGAFGKFEHFERVNVGGTQRLLKWACENAGFFAYFSSTAVYGYGGYKNLAEDAEKVAFCDPYSQTKLLAEKEVEAACKNAGIDYVIIRPGNVFGEYDYTSSHQIYSRVKNQKMMICAGGKYTSCFVYVKNLVDATIHVCLEKQFRNTDYNITDGEGETLVEYLTMVADEFGVKAKFTNVPAPLAKAFACLVEECYKVLNLKKPPLITKFSVWQNCNHYHFSINKLLSTGFVKKHSLAQGVKNTCKWFLEAENEAKN